MRYLDLEDYDDDMLSMEDWDYICDEAMNEAMEKHSIEDMSDEEYLEWCAAREERQREREEEMWRMGWRKL